MTAYELPQGLDPLPTAYGIRKSNDRVIQAPRTRPAPSSTAPLLAA